MNNIDIIIECVKNNHIEIPAKVQNRINYTLQNKTKKVNYFKRFAVAVASVCCVLLGSFGVYAVTGGTIEGIPALDWVGIRFSDKYVDYKKTVEDQKMVFENTSVELTSTVCNEGLTILEFDLKLSDEDKEKLKLEKSVVTEEQTKEYEKEKDRLKNKVSLELKAKKYAQESKDNKELDYNSVVVSESEINEEYEKQLKELDRGYKWRENTTYIPVLSLNYDQKGGKYNYDKFNPNKDWYASIFIDDEPYYIRNYEKVEQVNENEYKIYVLYFISDEILNGKNDFKITLKNNKLLNLANTQNISWRNDCQGFAKNLDAQMLRIEDSYIIDLPNDFTVNVSKDDILKDSIVMENLNIKSEFRNITQTVEKVVVSPIQTIVRINHSANKQSSKAFANRYDDPNIEHLPFTREYKVYDDKDHELDCFSSFNKSTLIYSDGTREDYDTHDLPNKKYDNATWEQIEYLLIENSDTKYLKIVPVENIVNPVDGEDKLRSGYEMEPLIINLK